MANRLLQRGFLFPTDCLLSHIIVKNVHDLSHLSIKFTSILRDLSWFGQDFFAKDTARRRCQGHGEVSYPGSFSLWES